MITPLVSGNRRGDRGSAALSVRYRGNRCAVPEDHTDDVDDLIATWIPLSRALNQLNRSMGKDDLYPFTLSPVVQDKLRFADATVAAAQAR
ncbi:putative zinc-binding metallopeptidase [Amycolatopsis camponoti]|nr:putative zinc-binding metallopeptidase [Amycolatopsis camponoti]